jgi:class 3 adenylate cyclase
MWEASAVGTVTFRFTDVEGSTRLWDVAPDAMRAALERQDAIVREAIGRVPVRRAAITLTYNAAR